MTIGLVLPAYNLSLEDVITSLESVRPLIDYVVVVHNDYPTDRPDPICTQLDGYAENVIHFDAPIGKTEAVRCGLKTILQNSSIDLVAQIDGRGKQPPSEVSTLISTAKQSRCEFVVANRYAHQSLADQEHRRTSTTLWTRLVSLTTGYLLADTVSGMRVYSRGLAEAFLSNIFCYGYGLEVAQLFVASRLGAEILDAGVSSRVQPNSTAAEKIEDNVAVFLQEARELTSDQRTGLSQLMSGLKDRRSFAVDGRPFSLERSYQFEFIGEGEDAEDSYCVKDVPHFLSTKS